jgi:hypothetical protein
VITERDYVVAGLLSLTAAAVLFWQLATAGDTDCFRRSVEIPIAGSDEVLSGCDSTSFDTVRSYITEQREAAAARTSVPPETNEVEAKAALLVWIALFAAAAGAAAFAAWQSIAIIRRLRPRWTAGMIGRIAGAAILVLLPFALFRLVSFDLSPFDDLHRSQVILVPPLIVVLLFPAVIALIAVWQELEEKADLVLDDAAYLGSLMRRLVGLLGAILALAVLTTAARWQAIGTLPGGEPVPSVIVLLWGSLFALVLAAFYIPVHQRWTRETARLISEEVARQLPDSSLPGTTGFRAPELALTKELQATLGLGGPLKSLQGSLSVLAPVIAAAVSSLFS